MSNAIRWSQAVLDEHLARKAARVNTKPVAAPPEPARHSKYASQKVEQNGIKFDSKKEARRWSELERMQAAGEISDLQRQVKFEMIPKQRRSDGAAERACHYIADFAYLRGGLRVVEDSKGFRTKDYIIKRKLMLHVHGITVMEV